MQWANEQAANEVNEKQKSKVKVNKQNKVRLAATSETQISLNLLAAEYKIIMEIDLKVQQSTNSFVFAAKALQFQ